MTYRFKISTLKKLNKKNKQIVTIVFLFIASCILNIFTSNTLPDYLVDIVFQFIIAAFGGFLLSSLTQYYKEGQWLKFWIWVYCFLNFYQIIVISGFLDQ
jgi:hypothetical protein